jgi:hypothetical protein
LDIAITEVLNNNALQIVSSRLILIAKAKARREQSQKFVRRKRRENADEKGGKCSSLPVM